MSRAFASRADVAAKAVTFTQLSENAYAYTTEGDPNTGVVVSDDGVLVVDAQATPDGMIIRGGQMTGGEVQSHGDHRRLSAQ